jgi:hypothetical protein
MNETKKSTLFIAVLSRRHDGRGDLDWQSLTNVARVLAAAYAGAGSQVETRTRAHRIPSSASFLTPWGLNRRNVVLPCCDPSIKLKTQGTLPIRSILGPTSSSVSESSVRKTSSGKSIVRGSMVTVRQPPNGVEVAGVDAHSHIPASAANFMAALLCNRRSRAFSTESCLSNDSCELSNAFVPARVE